MLSKTLFPRQLQATYRFTLAREQLPALAEDILSNISQIPLDLPLLEGKFHKELITMKDFGDEQRLFIKKMNLHRLIVHAWMESLTSRTDILKQFVGLYEQQIEEQIDFLHFNTKAILWQLMCKTKVINKEFNQHRLASFWPLTLEKICLTSAGFLAYSTLANQLNSRGITCELFNEEVEPGYLIPLVHKRGQGKSLPIFIEDYSTLSRSVSTFSFTYKWINYTIAMNHLGSPACEVIRMNNYSEDEMKKIADEIASKYGNFQPINIAGLKYKKKN